MVICMENCHMQIEHNSAKKKKKSENRGLLHVCLVEVTLEWRPSTKISLMNFGKRDKQVKTGLKLKLFCNINSSTNYNRRREETVAVYAVLHLVLPQD